jgi:hypothetical protein
LHPHGFFLGPTKNFLGSPVPARYPSFEVYGVNGVIGVLYDACKLLQFLLNFENFSRSSFQLLTRVLEFNLSLLPPCYVSHHGNEADNLSI